MLTNVCFASEEEEGIGGGGRAPSAPGEKWRGLVIFLNIVKLERLYQRISTGNVYTYLFPPLCTTMSL